MTEHPEPNLEAAGRAAQENLRNPRRLFGLGALGVALLLGYYGVTAKVEDPIHLYQGLVMLILAALPCLVWARRGSKQLPVFEVLMLTTANTYAFPLLNGQNELHYYSSEIITTAGLAVLLFQVVAIATHATIQGRPGSGPFFSEEVMTRDMQKYIGFGMVLSTLYIFIAVFFSELIPAEINSILRAVFYGIGLVSTFVQARRWGQKMLSPLERNALILMVTAQTLMQFSTLFLVGGLLDHRPRARRLRSRQPSPADCAHGRLICTDRAVT